MREDVLGAIGIADGSANRNQAGGGGNDRYAAQIRACIRPNVSFPTPPRSSVNPTAQYRVQLSPDGQVTHVALLASAGISGFDRAVEVGIRACSPFPRPPSGRYPAHVDVDYRMYD